MTLVMVVVDQWSIPPWGGTHPLIHISLLTPHTQNPPKQQKGDFVLLKGKKRKDTVCVAVPDETLDGAHVRLTKVVRGNLRVHLSDVVSLQKVEDVKTGKKVRRVALTWM